MNTEKRRNGVLKNRVNIDVVDIQQTKAWERERERGLDEHAGHKQS